MVGNDKLHGERDQQCIISVSRRIIGAQRTISTSYIEVFSPLRFPTRHEMIALLAPASARNMY